MDQNTQNNESDIFEIAQTIISGKWIVLAITVIGLLLVFGYSKKTRDTYKLTIAYKAKVHNIQDYEYGRSLVDIEENLGRHLLFIAADNWIKVEKFNKLVLNTNKLFDKQKILKDFEDYNQIITNEIYGEAKKVQSIIESKLTSIQASSPRVSRIYIIVNKVIDAIDNGEMAIAYGTLKIENTTVKLNKLLYIFLGILGLMIGVFVVLFRSGMQNHKRKLLNIK